MGNWADYVITRVRYNTAGTHIDQVEVADQLQSGLGPARSESRATVVANIATWKKSYCTAPPAASPGYVVKGARVELVKINNVDYLTTQANKTARDNLGNLPTF